MKDKVTRKALRGTFLAACAIGICGSVLGEAELQVGDTLDRVYEVLGEPRGYIRSEEFQVVYYERGRVELRGEIVSALRLVSEEEARARRAERERRERERQEALKKRREELREEGLAVKAQKLADDRFLSGSGREQLEFWDWFRRRYPDVDVELAYASARARFRAEEQAAQERMRLAELERRVVEAEERAEEAEKMAEESLRRRRTSVRYVLPAYTHYYPRPYVVTPGWPAPTP